MRKHIIVVAGIFAQMATGALAWDGTDTKTGNGIDVRTANPVRSGDDIEIYDYATGTYRDVTVQHINRYGSTVEIEVYDSTTKETRTLELPRGN